MSENKTSIFDLAEYDSPFGSWKKEEEEPPSNSEDSEKDSRAERQSTLDDTKPELTSDIGGYLLKGNYLKNGMIWKGFRHQWILTNHRTNRLGSLIVPETDYYEEGNNNAKADRAQIIHTGASGTASDVLRHNDYFTEVKSDKTFFYSGTVGQKIEGKSGEMTDFIFDIEVPIDPNLDPNFTTATKVFLNGFDIFCNNEGRARKLIYLAVDTSLVTVSKNNAQTKFLFQLKGKIKLNCQSGECKKINDEDDITLDKFNYTIRLAFLLVGGEDFSATKLTDLTDIPDDYEETIIQKTDSKREIFSLLDHIPNGNPHKVVGADLFKIKFPRNNNILPSCTAIHRIKYENRAIDHNTEIGVPAKGKDHAYAHMLEYDFAIYREFINNYNVYEIGRSLFFKNWHSGIGNITFDEAVLFGITKIAGQLSNIKWQIKHNNHSSTMSFRTAGDFEMEMGLSMLNFENDSEVSSVKNTDELYDQNDDSKIVRENYYQDKMVVLKDEISRDLIENYYDHKNRRPLIVWAALDTPSDGVYVKGTNQLPNPFNLPPAEDKEYEKTHSAEVSIPVNSLLYKLED